MERRPEVVVAGHVCLDVVPALEGPARLDPGRLIMAGPAAVSTGGAVPNTGLALHRLGVGVRLVGRIGDDLFGRAVLGILEDAGTGLSEGMIVVGGEATSYSIVISPPGVDRSFIHCTGANDGFTDDDVHLEPLAGARLFHFGYPPIMREMYAGGGARLTAMFAKVRGAGLATALDMCLPDPGTGAGRVDWQRVLAGALPFVDVFLPSIDELLLMLEPGSPPGRATDRPLLAALAERLLAMGPAIVVIKLGDQGLYVRTTHDRGRLGDLCDRLGMSVDDWLARQVLSPCFRAEQVAGTTGSGDCTIAGFLAALLRGEAPAAAATSATAVGACSVEAPTATGGIPPWPDVAARLRSGWERLPTTIAPGPDADARPDALGTLTFVAHQEEET